MTKVAPRVVMAQEKIEKPGKPRHFRIANPVDARHTPA
jgi:hypothetical protein